MSSAVSVVNQLLGILTIVGQAAIILAWPFRAFISKNALLSAFLVALIATSGSLFYSEIAGYEPCKLCWFQRIFMYPQVILLGLALWKKDYGIKFYGIVLSSIGAVIAGYHYLLQLGVAPALPCAAVGYSVACSQRFVLQFGYITIPMMALTAFLLIIIFLAARDDK